jgi:ribonuclease E
VQVLAQWNKMPKKMLIDATHAEETRVVVVDGNKVEEFDFEAVAKRQLAGNIYLAKVTRVEPSLQAAFVDYGGNRHGFLAFAEIHPDYYQIPVEDRRALMEEERAYQRSQDEGASAPSSRSPQKSRGPRPQAAKATRRDNDAVTSAEIGALDVVDLGEETGVDALADPLVRDTVAEAQVTPMVEAEGEATGPGGELNGDSTGDDNGETPFRAMDHAADMDDEIESVAEEDVAEEIAEPRRPRSRRYKIQEVIKVRQIMLVQVVKEERGNKGAALTTYLSLAGRYCVLMPNTARGGGISRKITNPQDRKKLKEIAAEIDVPEGAGLIIRTAGAKRTKPEVKRDCEYLMRLWEQIRELTLKSIAPAPIYEEGNLIKRSIRDLYSREIDQVLVEGAEGYRAAKDFMRMIMPSNAKVVQQYTDSQPLFARFGVESYLAGMFNPTVQLKSGGYIVIGITEALVAIDINSGRATKEGSIEETALKTNLEAADEIARQLRLRDLAGLIVIDFIDMEERRNNAAVEKRLKDKLKTDRARIQVGRISGFGLLEMSRQRLRPGMLESTTKPCPHCHGTGLIRSDDSQALMVLRALEEEGTRKRSREVLLRAPIAVINFLFNNKREHIALIEQRYGMAIRMEADPTLISPDFVIEKFKTAIRTVAQAPIIQIDMPDMPEFDEEEVEEPEVDEAEEAEPTVDAAATAPGAPSSSSKKKRRRRRRGSGKSGQGGQSGSQTSEDDDDDSEEGESTPEDTLVEVAPEAPAAVAEVDVSPAPEPVESAPVKKTTRKGTSRSSTSKSAKTRTAEVVVDAAAEGDAPVQDEPAAKPAAKKKTATTKAKSTGTRTSKAKAAKTVETTEAAPEAPVAEVEPAPALTVEPQNEVTVPEPSPEPVADEPAPAPEPQAPKGPRRAGWWSAKR